MMGSSPPSSIRGSTEAPRLVRASRTTASAKGITSTGTGTPDPSWVVILDSSTTMMSSPELKATTFSRNKAPPPPLIRLKFSSTWSAPSMVRSTPSTSSSPRMERPSSSASCRVCTDVGMHWISLTCPSFTRSASARMAHSAVEPVPRPTTIPSFTYSAALRPARSLASICAPNV